MLSSVIFAGFLSTICLGKIAQPALNTEGNYDTVVDAINANFPILAGALAVYPAVSEALSNVNGSFTVFAPTDEAFGTALATLGLSAEDFLADPETVTAVMNHALSVAIAPNGFWSVVDSYLPTLASYRLIEIATYWPDQTPSGDFVVELSDNNVVVIGQGYECGNGYVYTVDTVILPTPPEQIRVEDVLRWSPEFSVLASALACTLDSAPSACLPPSNVTLLAPTDEAFVALAEAWQLTPSELLADPRLEDILALHLIDDEAVSPDDLAAKLTALDNGLSYDNGDMTLTDASGRTGMLMTLSTMQVPAEGSYGRLSNGVVYKLDAVLIPYSKPLLQQLTDDGYTLMVELLTAAGLSDMLSTPLLGAYTVVAVDNGDLTESITGNDMFDTVDDFKAWPYMADWMSVHVITQFVPDRTGASYMTLSPQGIQATFSTSGVQAGPNKAWFRGLEFRRRLITGFRVKAATNGGYYVVDQLMETSPSSLRAVDEREGYDAFTSLVQADAVMSEALSGATKYTVFAVSDATITGAGLTAEQVAALPTLDDILAYHVAMTTNDLQFIANSIAPSNQITTLEGQTLTVSIEGENLAVTDQTGVLSIISALETTANGVLYDVANILSPLDSVVEKLQADPNDQFSILLTALSTANLISALDNNNGAYTMFAPNNSAFEALLTEMDVTTEELLQLPTLPEILSYHLVTAGEWTAQQLIDAGAEALNPLTTLYDYSNLSIMIESVTEPEAMTTVKLMDVRQRTSTVTATDMLASNAVIHTIDTVLLPLKTVGKLIEDTSSLSTLELALTSASLLSTFTVEKNVYTVFAPDDAAFTAYLEANEMSPEELLALENIAQILTYHVVPGYVTAESVIELDGTSVATLEGGLLLVSVSEGVVTLTDEMDTAITVTMTDMLASNGVIHTIDSILMPEPPTASPTMSPTPASDDATPTPTASSAPRNAIALFSTLLLATVAIFLS